MIKETEAAAVKEGSRLAVNGRIWLKVLKEHQPEKEPNSPSETKAFDVELDDGTRTAMYVTWHRDLSAHSASVKVGNGIFDVNGINTETERDNLK